MLGGWPIVQPVELDNFAWLGLLEEQLAIVEAFGVNQIPFFPMRHNEAFMQTSSDLTPLSFNLFPRQGSAASKVELQDPI